MDDKIEYSKREHIARIILAARGLHFPMDESLIDEAESIMRQIDPRVIHAVETADKILAVVRSRRTTWPAQI